MMKLTWNRLRNAHICIYIYIYATITVTQHILCDNPTLNHSSMSASVLSSLRFSYCDYRAVPSWRQGLWYNVLYCVPQILSAFCTHVFYWLCDCENKCRAGHLAKSRIQYSTAIFQQLYRNPKLFMLEARQQEVLKRVVLVWRIIWESCSKFDQICKMRHHFLYLYMWNLWFMSYPSMAYSSYLLYTIHKYEQIYTSYSGLFSLNDWLCVEL